MAQGIEEQIRAIPAIEQELHLFEVGRKMLGANSVPRSHDSALKKRECGFNRIRVNVSHVSGAESDRPGAAVATLPSSYRTKSPLNSSQ